MSTVIKFSASVSPPDSIKEYGEGDFLVGFWGQPIQYTKNAQLWYEHPKHIEWTKGNYADLSDFTLNDNDITLDFTSTPIFISQFHVFIVNTATSGSRIFQLDIIGTDESRYSLNNPHTASETTNIHFGGTYVDNDLSGFYTNDISFPKFWNESIPFWNKILIKDYSTIDGNDDYRITLRGVYALPKYHWIELKNCKNFQVRKVTETLSDGIFSGVTLGPRSLKVLKI